MSDTADLARCIAEQAACLPEIERGNEQAMRGAADHVMEEVILRMEDSE